MNQLRIEHVAIATRNFMDVTDIAREAGFHSAVAVSIVVYSAYVALPRMGPLIAFGEMQRQVRDRLWNVLSACRDAINAQRNGKLTQLDFHVYTRSAGPYAFSSRYQQVLLRVTAEESSEGLLIDRAEPGDGQPRQNTKRGKAGVRTAAAIRRLSLPVYLG